MQRRAILVSPQCGDITSCIRHLVSDRRLSLISKERIGFEIGGLVEQLLK